MMENENYVVLQPEIWNKILLKVWENEEDLETLLTCRLVCRSWEELIDKMPPNLHWNPWLRVDIQAKDIFEKAPATSFKTDEDIIQFASFMAKLCSSEVKKNPFCRKTVKLFDHDSQNRISSDGVEKLLKILDEHGHHIHQLYYSPKSPLPNENVLPFPPLLPTMTNLRTLAVNLLYMTVKERNDISGENFAKNLENLQELVIIEERVPVQIAEWDNINPIYEKFFISYGSQIKSLTLNQWSLDGDRINANSIYERFPNLEEFKVENLLVERHYVVAENLPWPKLKRLALGMSELTENSLEFREVLRFVPSFFETLEVLSLDFLPAEKGFSGLGIGPSRLMNLHGPFNVDPKGFPKLEKLILPFRLMCFKGQSNLVPLEGRLNVRLPCLKSLVLEDTEDGFKHRKINGAELSEICSQMWHLLPPSVETISLRVLRTNEALKRDFPVIYKCQRVRLAGWQV